MKNEGAFAGPGISHVDIPSGAPLTWHLAFWHAEVYFQGVEAHEKMDGADTSVHIHRNDSRDNEKE